VLLADGGTRFAVFEFGFRRNWFRLDQSVGWRLIEHDFTLLEPGDNSLRPGTGSENELG